MSQPVESKEAKPNEDSHPVELDPPPDYLQPRVDYFDSLKAKQDAAIAAKEPVPIKVTLPDGKVLEGSSWRTTPFDIAGMISKGLADNAVIAKVNGELFDLERPLERDCSLEILNFDSPEGQQVFWHSSAHILGEAMERHYGGLLCYGPPIDGGFYYDMFMKDRQVTPADFGKLDTIFNKAVKEKQPFVRLEMTKEELKEMFKYNEFKLRIIDQKITTPTTTVYRCGPLIDLCRGPHVRHTGKIKAHSITKNSASYWEGKATAESLQRIYGISFPDNKRLKEWKTLQEEAAKRDHRKIGRDHELYFFHELSPGSCFFHPRGAHVYNTLTDFIRTENRRRGYQEVISPNVYNLKLWEISGHKQHYAANMFKFDVENETFALKPMNCPGHCLMFDHRPRSWRELPLRFADFGVLHRNEISGALSGLTRVRRFQQDDAHIFCTLEQVEEEIKGCLDYLKCVYGILGFKYELYLSTRPEDHMGDIAVWDRAEQMLAKSLDGFGEPWKLNPGDGAFYGPKIDIVTRDALKRGHQCATIQLDFQLPERFNLNYVTGDSSEDRKRPVMIHRAMLGSVERMIAILTEQYAGKWPFWLSPRQAMVIPVTHVPKLDQYAVEVQKKLFQAGFMVDTDLAPGDTLNKKIRNAQLEQYNYILVVGEKEAVNGTVNMRTRDNVVHGEVSIDKLLALFQRLKDEKDMSETTEIKS